MTALKKKSGKPSYSNIANTPVQNWGETPCNDGFDHPAFGGFGFSLSAAETTTTCFEKKMIQSDHHAEGAEEEMQGTVVSM